MTVRVVTFGPPPGPGTMRLLEQATGGRCYMLAELPRRVGRMREWVIRLAT